MPIMAPKHKIINGQEIDIREAPWVVYLKHMTSECTAVYLGNGWVMSAAHCVESKNSISVYFGITDWCNEVSNNTAIQIEAIYVNPTHKFSPYGEPHPSGDITLLKISNTFLPPKVQPIHYDEYIPGFDVYTYGYGLIENDESTCNLRKTNVFQPSDYENCENSEIIVFEGSTGTNGGDSGGPSVFFANSYAFPRLYDNPTLVGINSSGITDFQNNNFKSKMVNLCHYDQWIQDVMDEKIEPSIIPSYPKDGGKDEGFPSYDFIPGIVIGGLAMYGVYKWRKRLIERVENAQRTAELIRRMRLRRFDPQENEMKNLGTRAKNVRGPKCE